ncbi:hypothetical protein [Helicobacter zhangjianzhongii]|uniref:hypothetical protein n=1 Tax=Helicobacter zhangjianzhongii TaxID=2974574 RepID=UPI0025546949|nr:hypothetical protein [Helicobacter sp. CPD2-1]MDL0079458.1 hypothetical protein [Helicobacter sp. CPD2-1]
MILWITKETSLRLFSKEATLCHDFAAQNLAMTIKGQRQRVAKSPPSKAKSLITT